MSNILETKADFFKARSLYGEGAEALEAVTTLLPTLIGNHWSEIERIPANIQCEDVNITREGISIGKIRVGINIIPK